MMKNSAVLGVKYSLLRCLGLANPTLRLEKVFTRIARGISGSCYFIRCIISDQLGVLKTG